MDITVRKPTDEEKCKLQDFPIWGCEVSEFDWYYDSEEVCLLIEGEVTVIYDKGNVTIGTGDYAIFPKGLSCIWKVTKPVQKYYYFKED